jgi:hypothetical protein
VGFFCTEDSPFCVGGSDSNNTTLAFKLIEFLKIESSTALMENNAINRSVLDYQMRML